MRKIKLTQGKYTLVDDSNFEWLNKWEWHFTYYGYAARTTGSSKNKDKKGILMHRLIIQAEEKEEVDHINRNKLDNRLKNLRIVNRSINNINRGKRKDNTSGYKGVSYEKNTKSWAMDLAINKKRIRLRGFKTKLSAYRTYCKLIKNLL